MLFLLVLASCAERGPVARPKSPYRNPLEGVEVLAADSFHKGLAAYEEGNQLKARKEFQKVLQQNADYYPAHLAFAYTYLAEDNYELAEGHIRRALEIAPDYPQAHYALASVYEARQDYDSALSELQHVSRVDPNYPDIQQSVNVMKLKATERHLNLGMELKESDPNTALQHLQLARELAPEVPQILLEISEILVRQNRCQEAIEPLQQVNTELPQNASVKQMLAECYFNLGQYPQALQAYKELLILAPANTEVRNRIRDVEEQILIQGLPEEYQMIPGSPEVTRSQFAALLMINAKFLDRLSARNSHIITDTLHHWAHKYVRKVVDLGIIDLFPNRTFRPNQPLTRLELAKAVSRILELLKATQGLNVTTDKSFSIPDIPESSLYYPMIAQALASGIISLDGDGNFHLYRTVSGAEAMSVVNHLKTLAERP